MKSHTTRVLIAVTVLLLAQNQFASANDAVDGVIGAARAECKSFDNGVLTFNRQKAVSFVDLTDNGKKEAIVDSNQFKCSTAASLFCGSGGCSLTVIVKDKPFELLATGWKTQKDENSKTLLKIGVHWSQCDYKRPCWESLSWDGKMFKSLGSKVEK